MTAVSVVLLFHEIDGDVLPLSLRAGAPACHPQSHTWLEIGICEAMFVFF